MAAHSLEHRVAALEAEVAQLKKELQGRQEGADWHKIIGTFANDPSYDKAMEYGRKYPESLRPGKRKNRTRGSGNS